MQRVDYARVVRKGAAARAAAWSGFGRWRARRAGRPRDRLALGRGRVLMALPKAAGPDVQPAVLARAYNAIPAPSIQVDGARLFFDSRNQIWTVAAAGGTPAPIGDAVQYGIGAMVQDQRNLFIVTDWSKVVLVPKPDPAAP